MQCSIETRLSALPQIAEAKLFDILDKIPGQKNLIIDGDLISPLQKIVGVTKLRSHGVNQIFVLDKLSPPVANCQRVYFIKADLITAKYVCDQINSEVSLSQMQNTSSSSLSRRNNHIILVPRKLLSIVNLFEEEGVFGHVTLYTFRLEPLLLDSKLLSDEFEGFFKMLFVSGNQSFLPSVAKSIWSILMLLGKPHQTVTIGKYSSIVVNILNTYCDSICSSDRDDSDIGCLVVVDRSVDYTSVLLTPGTYTGLLDEVFHIKCGTVNIEMDNNKSFKLNLNNADEIYTQIKSRHFSDVFTYLKSKAEVLRGEFKKSQNMDLKQMKHYVSKELKSVALLKTMLTYHIGACEAIISKIGQRFESLQNVIHSMLNCKNHRENIQYIENCIATDLGNKYDILRLISLLSLTNDGLAADELNSIKTQFLHKYGYNYLNSFSNLQSIGLISEQTGMIKTGEASGGILATKVVHSLPSLPMRRSAYYGFSQKLKLLPETTDGCDLKDPKDMSYVYGGAYIPLICQLVSSLIKKDVSLEELEKLIPNLTFKYSNGNVNKQTYFVYIIGGVTYAETAAFQLLEKLTGTNIYVAGTSVINGNLLMESFL